jgi:serine/threonine protein kinase
MGNICGKDGAAAADGNAGPHHDKKPHGGDHSNINHKVSSHGDRSTAHSIHDGILHKINTDVYGKYQEIEVLGTGSMGHVARVKVKDGVESRSAYRAQTSDSNHSGNKSEIAPRSTSSSISERKKEYALKSIQLDRVSPAFMDELANEIDILKTLDHPNIVRLHEVFYQKNKQIYMILELCDGGDLYTRLPYSEKDCAYIAGKLLSAVKYMHDHGIVHRDCK